MLKSYGISVRGQVIILPHSTGRRSKAHLLITMESYTRPT